MMMDCLRNLASYQVIPCRYSMQNYWRILSHGHTCIWNCNLWAIREESPPGVFPWRSGPADGRTDEGQNSFKSWCGRQRAVGQNTHQKESMLWASKFSAMASAIRPTVNGKAPEAIQQSGHEEIHAPFLLYAAIFPVLECLNTYQTERIVFYGQEQICIRWYPWPQ